jgi:hypothetical protein
MHAYMRFLAVWACAAACLILVADIKTPLRVVQGDPYEHIGLSAALGLYQIPDNIFVDARLNGLFQQGHIKGAIGIMDFSHPATAAVLIRRLKAAPNVVLYGGRSKAECNQALKLLAGLRIYGLKYYEPGWPEWSSLNLPSEH